MGAWRLVKATASEFAEDNAMMMSAALAFYSALSLAPLLILLIWASSFLGPEAQSQIVSEIRSIVGEQAGQAIGMIVENARERPDVRNLAGILGFAALLFSATGVFAQLQKAMNLIWDVKPRPGQGAAAWVRKRLVSLGMVLTIGFLLLISLVLTTALSAAIGRVESALPGGDYLWRAMDFVTALLVYTLLFASIYKLLPDVHIEWREVWAGAIVTAILFAIGRTAIGLYLGHSGVGSAYGAAGSFLVLLIWVYYSSIILFLGTELTQVGARRFGHEIRPDRHAVWADRKPHGPPGQTPQPA